MTRNLTTAVKTQLATNEIRPLAKKCYEQTLKLDPSFCEAKHILNSLSGKTTKSAPKKYVEKLFDNYAANFEKSLIKNLKYNTPKIIKEMIIDYNMVKYLNSVSTKSINLPSIKSAPYTKDCFMSSYERAFMGNNFN